MTSTHILYSFRRCPYAMRARMGLKMAGIDYEHREILLRENPAEMLAVSPKGTVPVFVRKDGQVIEESFDIMLWALAQNDPEHWLEPDMDTMLALIQTIEGPFIHHLGRYKYASWFDKSLKRGDVDRNHRDQACAVLEDFEKRLADRPYLMGEKKSLADYAIFPFIRQFGAVEKDWWDAPQFPHMHAWLADFLADPIFIGVMDKYPLFVSQHPS